jgi:MFS family permease
MYPASAAPQGKNGPGDGANGQPSMDTPQVSHSNPRLALLLAMAMFVLVVDTSIMNVSISAVVHDIGTTVSGVQSAIALEALVSAAFILIGSKVGDLIGRKRAYVLGLLGYAAGALAMAFTQSLTVIIIFWAIVGGLGASLLLPAMQSLIHGNFEGAEQRKAYALVGAAAAIAAAVGPLLGGFITTYLSWRIAFLLEDLIILIVLSGIRLVKDVPYTGPRHIDIVGAVLSVIGMGGLVLGILVWQEGGEAVIELLVIGSGAMGGFVFWILRQKRLGRPALIDPGLFKLPHFRFGATGQMMQQISLGGLMIALPIYLQMVFEYNAMQAGLSMAPLSLSMFAVALFAGKKAGKRRPATIIRAGFALTSAGILVLIPFIPRVDSGWYLILPLLIVGSGLGLLVSQLNNYTLAPISEEGVSEAAGVNSAAGSFGLSFGLAFAGAIMLATLSLSFNHLASQSAVLTSGEQQHVAQVLEHDAQVLSNTQLANQLAGQPKATRDELLSINTEARHDALRFALLVPLFAGLVGLFNSFRMMRLPDPPQSESTEGLALG